MNSIERFQQLLRELFQYDSADLDFGIYRVLNLRRDALDNFIQVELVQRLDDHLQRGSTGRSALAAAELERLAAEVRDALGDTAIGADGKLDEAYATTPIGRRYAESYEASAGPHEASEMSEQVMNHLYNFFSRYYDDGDFLTKRRYSQQQKYIVPYNGEEVLLHWTNNDQYYIKTGDRFTTYRFNVLGTQVLLKVARATVPRDNTKDDDLYFVPIVNDVVLEGSSLTIPFERRPLRDSDGVPRRNRKSAQQVLNQAATESLLKKIKRLDQNAYLACAAQVAGDPETSQLSHHLGKFTGRNTSDFFVHRDLKGFLRRELDFYLKNEVLNVSDLVAGGMVQWEMAHELVEVISGVADDIIDFLHQVEDFQRRMFEKRKLVLASEYCVSLQVLPRELHDIVLDCDAQWSEWTQLHDLSSKYSGLSSRSREAQRDARKTVLAQEPSLMLDTRHLSRDAKDRVLGAFDDLESLTDGVLVNGENYQALNLLAATYKGRIKGVYIDPPYNTSGTEILYKNAYKHSSWLTLMANRLTASVPLMADECVQCTLIDDTESAYLHVLLEKIFGRSNYLSTVAIRSKPQGRAVPSGFSENHEYAIFYSVTGEGEVGRLPRDERQLRRYRETDDQGIFTWANFRKTGQDSRRADRRHSYYPVYVDEDGGVTVPTFEWDRDREENVLIDEPLGEAVFPLDDEDNERVWTLGWERAQRDAATDLKARKIDDKWQVYRKYRPNQTGALPGTWWDSPKYSASESGTKLLRDMMGGEVFSFPKSIYAVEDCLRASGVGEEDVVLDYYGGSGTTAHATINMNRADGGHRKFVVVEMGDYFQTALLPRLKKAVYAPEWRDGRPTRGLTDAELAGTPRAIHYLTLESYDDCLSNLELSADQGVLFNDQDYVIRYMLDLETRDSAILLGGDALERPFDLEMTMGTSQGDTTVKPDLPTSFALLIGLRIQRRITSDNEGRKYVVHVGTVEERSVVVVWRETAGWQTGDFQRDRSFIEQSGWVANADEVFVNGDSLVPGARSLDGLFRDLMFAAVP